MLSVLPAISLYLNYTGPSISKFDNTGNSGSWLLCQNLTMQHKLANTGLRKMVDSQPQGATL